MIAAGVIGGVFLICTVVMFLGVKERDGETRFFFSLNLLRCSGYRSWSRWSAGMMGTPSQMITGRTSQKEQSHKCVTSGGY